jgi:hypothetical protein
MGRMFNFIVKQKKAEIKKTKKINNNNNHNNNNNNETKNICHACRCEISEYETFYFLNTAYCDLCYVLLAYTL